MVDFLHQPGYFYHYFSSEYSRQKSSLLEKLPRLITGKEDFLEISGARRTGRGPGKKIAGEASGAGAPRRRLGKPRLPVLAGDFKMLAANCLGRAGRLLTHD
jgi:hypothetical protein